MYQALAESLNLPAVATANELGLNTVFDYGTKFGLNMDKVDRSLGVALGSGVTTNPLQMAQAFTNGTGVNAAPYGYTMAGKTGTTETDFNPDLSGDQWVIGYTPDVVISQWLGFPKTDETHYLTGTSAETASVIFRNVANSVLPYTEGTSFDNEKNSYQENGIAPVGQETETESPEEDKGFFDTVKERAAGIVDDAKKAIDEADIPGKAQNAWDTFKGWFGF